MVLRRHRERDHCLQRRAHLAGRAQAREAAEAERIARGWRLLPIALGPQASCQPRFPRYQDDFKISNKPAGGYATAAAQG